MASIAISQSWVFMRLNGDFVFDPSQYQPNIGADRGVVLVGIVLLGKEGVCRLVSRSRLRHCTVEASSNKVDSRKYIMVLPLRFGVEKNWDFSGS